MGVKVSELPSAGAVSPTDVLPIDQGNGQQLSKVTISLLAQAVGGVPTGGTVGFLSSLSLPNGFLRCDGSAVSRTTYATLFGVVGTAYGAGDGVTTFTLPNLANTIIKA